MSSVFVFSLITHSLDVAMADNTHAEKTVIKRYIDTQSVSDLCQRLYAAMVTDRYKPDLIIGLSRGGLIPLGYLASERMFNNRRVEIISVASYADTGEQGELKLLSPFFEHDLEHLKQYNSILVVDDLVDSGKTLHFVVNKLRALLPHATFTTATLFYKENTLFMPDYYVEQTTDWLVFPWEN